MKQRDSDRKEWARVVDERYANLIEMIEKQRLMLRRLRNDVLVQAKLEQQEAKSQRSQQSPKNGKRRVTRTQVPEPINPFYVPPKVRYVNLIEMIDKQQSLLRLLEKQALDQAELDQKKTLSYSSKQPPKKGKCRAARTPAPRPKDPFKALPQVRGNKKTR